MKSSNAMKRLRSSRPHNVSLALSFGFAALAMPLLLLGASATADDAAPHCETKPYVVKIHADWCGSCRATQATWEKVVADLSDEATMVQFDVTDRASYEAAVTEAEQLGISDFLFEFRRRTGAIAVLDCRTLAPLVVLSGERDFEKYRDAIRKANSPS
jgi:thiol-disulfide isomerase/thioredoxin